MLLLRFILDKGKHLISKALAEGASLEKNKLELGKWANQMDWRIEKMMTKLSLENMIFLRPNRQACTCPLPNP